MHKHLHIEIYKLFLILYRTLDLFLKLCTLVGDISILTFKDSEGDIAKYLLQKWDVGLNMIRILWTTYF